MTIKQLLDEDKKTSKAFRKFFNSCRAKTSKTKYTLQLDRFMMFAKLDTYQKLVDLSVDDRQDLLEEWIMSMRDKSKSLCAFSFNAVRKLMDMNRCVYFPKLVTALFPSDVMQGPGRVPYTREEIHMMLDVCTNTRGRFLVLFFTSTGSRPGGIDDEDGHIQMKHIKDMPNGCANIKIYAGTKFEYDVFLTPEAKQAMESYISFRKQCGEVITPDSSLFVTVRTKETLGRPLNSPGVRHAMERIVKKSGVRRTKINGKYNKAIIYGFRKWFNGILKMDNSVNSNIAEKLMAHTRGLDGTYLTTTTEQCFKEFQKVVKQLTINEESRLRVENLELNEQMSKVTTDAVYKVFELMGTTVEEFTEFVNQKHKDRKYK